MSAETMYDHEIVFVNGMNWKYENDIFELPLSKKLLHCELETWEQMKELERETYFRILDLHIEEEKSYKVNAYINKELLLEYLEKEKNKEQSEIVKKAKCTQYSKGTLVEIADLEKVDSEKMLILDMLLTRKEIEKINKFPWTSFSVEENITYLSFEFPHEIFVSNEKEKIDEEIIQILEEYKGKIRCVINGNIEKETFYTVIEQE